MAEESHEERQTDYLPLSTPEQSSPKTPAPPVPVIEYLKPILLIVLVLFLDQWLKVWVKTTFFYQEQRPLFGEAIDWAYLHFIENNGIAFGLELPGTGGKVLLTSFRLIVASFIFYALMRLVRRGANKGFVTAGALVFAGAFGNIIDSIFYGVIFAERNLYPGGWFQGKVVDMLYFPLFTGTWPSWVPLVGGDTFEFFQPIFNIADAAITAGILLIVFFYRKSLKEL